jgi:cytochrome c oxidase subunit 2
MGRLLLLTALVPFVLAGCSRSTWETNFAFGMPKAVTDQAQDIRVLYTWSSVVALFVGAIVWGLIFWCVIRYRKRSEELPRQTKYNLPVEVAYTIAPFLIIGGLFFFTVRTENFVDKLSPNPDTTVEVVAFRWNWEFDYLQYHGQKISYPGENTVVGTVGNSNEIPILVIPDGQSVRFIEHSEDVMHSFWVPDFLFKRDVIPYGSLSTLRDNQFEIVPTSTGAFVGRCAELCGTYHSQMNFEVRVVPPAKYEQYLAALVKYGPDNPGRQALALQAIGEVPTAVTTHPFPTERTYDSAVH